MKQALTGLLLIALAQASTRTPAQATPTENNGIRILPAPAQMSVDGKATDWDLSGGIFICDDVQTQRGNLNVWVHAQYDAGNLYLLARFKDQSPLNNPGQTLADFGFQGDSLQARIVTNVGAQSERGNHFTAWRGAGGTDVIAMEGGKAFDEPGIRDVKAAGGKQAFTVDADGKGYAQEIALPWSILTRDGEAPRAGSQIQITFEPNFTVGINGRMSIKDNFQPGQAIDRVFTFQNPRIWGPGSLESKRSVAPQPVRLADGREFSVRMEQGVPVVNWDGLIRVESTPGFKPITFTMPQDGFISLNIKNAGGQVVRQLLNGAFFSKGAHTVQWDGLPTPNLRLSGEPLPAGSYRWSALFHTGIGLKLRGWAHNAGAAPWDNGPASNWGGDFGNPISAASDGPGLYLGWGLAEAGKAIVATDLQGRVRWSNKRGGIGGVRSLAVEGGVLYVLGGSAGPASEGGSLYKLATTNGSYVPWDGGADADLSLKTLWSDVKDAPEKADAIAARGGQIYLSFTAANKIAVLDAKSGKRLQVLEATAPGSLWAKSDTQLYAISGGKSVVLLNPADGTSTSVISGLSNASGLAGDESGALYVGTNAPDYQVKVFDAGGKYLRSIGRRGGRVQRGPWIADAFANINGLALDSQGKLWAAENADYPKRFSVWNARAGTLARELFGPTTYGATGGAINPRDPNLMVGNGCEWRIDPKTGQATCVGVVAADAMGVSRFATGSNGRLYLAVAPGAVASESPYITIYERLGDADYRVRGKFSYAGEGAGRTTSYWADANGDGQQQAAEVQTVPGYLRIGGWYMGMGPDLTAYAGYSQLKTTGFAASGAPLYDLAHPVKMPNAGEGGGMGAIAGLGSADARLVLYNAAYGAERSVSNAYDIASGKLLWSYPSNFVGVHGSHAATPAQPGLIRGAYDIAGTARLPAPIGNIWAIPTNVGEWHLLTEEGFYLAGLFQPDPLKVQFPEQAVPGADMSQAPPGMGGEDFGGSMTLAQNGKLYLQAGKTAFWNLEVTGLDTVRALPGATLALAARDIPQARAIREAQLQVLAGKKAASIKKSTPTFTANLDADFKGSDIISYSKGDEARVRSAMAWDEQNLYVGWDVADSTPWTNAARAAEEMYLSGDTVDLQLGTIAGADKNRAEAGLGDLRLSIGSFGGKDTAVIYRRLSEQKQPRAFNSGVFKNYVMQYVGVLADARITVARSGKGTVVEAAIPLSSLGLKPSEGLTLRGDVGVTYGDQAGQRTRLRSYWSNQQTGIVDDAVAELMMQPRNWGELKLTP